MLWYAHAAALLLTITTGLLYLIDGLLTDPWSTRWIHVSALIGAQCSDDPIRAFVAGLGNFGYGLSYVLLSIAFRQVYWRDRFVVKYIIGVIGLIALYLILGFPSGKSIATDIIHYSATGIALFMLTFYAILSTDRKKDPLSLIRDAAIILMIVSVIGMFTAAVADEWDRRGWNTFVAFQIAYLANFVVFLLTWGTLIKH